MVGPSEPAGLPPKAKVKAYKVLGDVGEFQERLAATLPPPKAPEPPNVFNIGDTSEFPPDVWFAATISPDNGVAVIASYRELCKARALYQSQLTNIHTARRQYGMGGSMGPGAGAPLPLPPAQQAAAENRTIAETMRIAADTRKLGKFEQQQAKWDEVSSTLAYRVGRAPNELAMQRGPAWRTRAELTELLYRAQPRDTRGSNPDEVWTASLRDAWERILPLGSIFSGLAIKIRDRPGELPATRATRVGRPLDPLLAPLGGGGTTLSPATLGHPAAAAAHAQHMAALAANGVMLGATTNKPPLGRSLSARGRSWEDSEMLKQRVAEYGTRLRALAPHDPDFGALVVAGEALESQLEALAGAPITLAEVEAHVRAHAPEAFDAYKAVKDEMEAQLRAALEAEEAQRAAVEAAAAAAAPRPGPHVAFSSPFVSLACHVGDKAHGSVTLLSRGTAAVNWSWRRLPAPQHAHAATELSQPPRFAASLQGGVLLPGQSLTVAVTFEAAAAGTFREDWELVTRPPLQGPEGPSLTLRLRGAAEVRDESDTGRRGLEESLAEREKRAKVAAALERVLRDVRMPRRPQPHEVPEEVAAGDAWDRVNGCAAAAAGGPYAWPPLFHSPGVQAELAEVYREAEAALAVALKPPVEEDPKKKKKETSARKGKKGDEPPPPPPKYPPSWTEPAPAGAGCSLAVLDELLAELAAVAPAAAAPLAARAEDAKSRARVPPNNRKVLRRAMRVLVGKMVDAVEEKFNLIRTDLEAKSAAEAAAIAAAAAAAAGEDGEDVGAEFSAVSVGAGKDAKDAKDKKAGGAKDAKEKPGAKGGKDKKGGSPSHTDDGAPAEPGAGLPNVEHLQPAFHDKATTAAKAAIKAALNTLLDEVHRHKVAAGDALEANIRGLDARIAAAQADALAARQQEPEPAAPAAEAAPPAGLALFAPPAGGVPAPGPGPAAPVRSSELEQLYWDKLCVLRTWTGLGIPTRADIR